MANEPDMGKDTMKISFSLAGNLVKASTFSSVIPRPHVHGRPWIITVLSICEVTVYWRGNRSGKNLILWLFCAFLVTFWPTSPRQRIEKKTGQFYTFLPSDCAAYGKSVRCHFAIDGRPRSCSLIGWFCSSGIRSEVVIESMANTKVSSGLYESDVKQAVNKRHDV